MTDVLKTKKRVDLPLWAIAPEEETFTGQPDAWVSLRREAYNSFIKTGLPTKRDEGWRNTPVGHLEAADFSISDGNTSVDRSAVEPYYLPNVSTVVLINGAYSEELSNLDGLRSDISLISLTDALEKRPDDVLSHLGQIAKTEDDPFVALNTSYNGDGVWLDVPANIVVDAPIQILLISTGSDQSVNFPRILITAGENAQLSVLERYISLTDTKSLSCPVTEIDCQPSAIVEHLRLQEEGTGSNHVGSVQIRQQRNSQVRTTGVSASGELVRNNVNCSLLGEGASTTMNGLYLGIGRHHVDNHTRIDHVAPRTTSNQLYKGILADASHGVFTGRVVVHPDAQKIEAHQTNRNLMLSDDALVHTDPQLEIFADDVKCTHGSTVGQIDDAALFYFRSRGIDEATARQLLMRGFAVDVLETIQNPVLKNVATAMVESCLDGISAS